MKKPISVAALLIVLILLSGLTACGKTAGADKDSMAGFYYLTDAQGVGRTNLMKVKDGVTLEVRGDNTATLALVNNKTEIRFDPDSMTCCPDDKAPVKYTFDGEQIVIDSKPFSMTFERES